MIESVVCNLNNIIEIIIFVHEMDLGISMIIQHLHTGNYPLSKESSAERDGCVTTPGRGLCSGTHSGLGWGLRAKS